MPLQNTSGNDTTDAYGGAAVIPNYIEDVFSTWLYTGNNSTQTITNGINLSGKGGLVWIKCRSNTPSHILDDTNNGVAHNLSSDSDLGFDLTSLISSFNSNGFSLAVDTGGATNVSPKTYASWTFRKQPKFFDVVTYTGTGSNRTIAHNLGSTPGCIIVKRTDTTGNWQVYHNGLTSAAYRVQLNLTSAQASATTVWNSTAPTSTVFSVGTDATVNASGGTYVAYIYASNAGGFGLTGTDNVISCGSFTTDASGNATVSLGYEPQWVLYKRTDGLGGWYMNDIMRGASLSGTTATLYSNYSSAETTPAYGAYPTATGFNTYGAIGSSGTFIYIAIRRGPMKVPTDATKVFAPVANTVSGNNQFVSTGFTVDSIISKIRTLTYVDYVFDRLRGSTTSSSYLIFTQSTNAETNITTNGFGLDNNLGYVDNFNYWNTSGSYTYGNWCFQRAPSFFDEVCYTGTGANTTITHNLQAVPELMIIKRRSTSGNNWIVYAAPLGNGNELFLNTTDASTADNTWQNTTPTSTVFSLSSWTAVNAAASTYVAYLFATCPGVSKVGSYTGTGATQTISCGFTGGARFVLVKRTDSTGNWVVLDTARGMVSGTDPYLNLNITAAEVNANNLYTTTGGFQLVSSDANFNASGGTYIFLAIA